MATTKTYPSRNKFPVTGVRGVIYIAQDTGFQYEFNQGYKLISGAPKTINNIPPNSNGNLPLTANDVQAIPDAATITINSETKQLSSSPSFETIKGAGTAGKVVIWTASDTLGDLSYTPEDVANKATNTSLGNSDTLYPTQNAVKTYVDNLAANPLIPYTPTFTGCSTNPTVDSDCCFYTVKGKEVTVFFVTKGAGTSNATTKTITLPIAAATVIGSTSFGYVCGGVTVANSGTFEPGFIRTQKGSNVADVLRSNISATFTASGSFNIWGVFTYPID